MLPLRMILHPTDFSRSAEQALDHALFLARQYDALLHLLHVIDIPPMSLPYLREDFFTQAKQRATASMDEMLASRPAEGIRLARIVLPGLPASPPAPVILEYAREHRADLIVMGTHGRHGLPRLFMGSVAEEVVHSAGCPVLTVHEQKTPFPARPLAHVLAPVDFSDASERALGYAKDVAAHYGARLTLLHVVEPAPPAGVYGIGFYMNPELPEEIVTRAHGRLQQLVAATDWGGLEVDAQVERAHAASGILDYASHHGVDLIVMASHGWSAFERFLLGGITAKVMRAAPCPVFIVRPASEASQPVSAPPARDATDLHAPSPT